MDKRGLARRGLLVRHLVMPGLVEDSAKIMKWLAEELSPNTYVNTMGQFRPEHRTHKYPEINRRPTTAEMVAAFEAGDAAGLSRFDERWLVG